MKKIVSQTNSDNRSWSPWESPFGTIAKDLLNSAQVETHTFPPLQTPKNETPKPPPQSNRAPDQKDPSRKHPDQPKKKTAPPMRPMQHKKITLAEHRNTRVLTLPEKISRHLENFVTATRLITAITLRKSAAKQYLDFLKESIVPLLTDISETSTPNHIFDTLYKCLIYLENKYPYNNEGAPFITPLHTLITGLLDTLTACKEAIFEEKKDQFPKLIHTLFVQLEYRENNLNFFITPQTSRSILNALNAFIQAYFNETTSEEDIRTYVRICKQLHTLLQSELEKESDETIREIWEKELETLSNLEYYPDNTTVSDMIMASMPLKTPTENTDNRERHAKSLLQDSYGY